jgi:hypothetical protein
VSAHTGHQLLNAKGFGHIIVGPGVERFNLRSFMIAHGKDQNWRGPLGADGAAYVDSTQSGHHQVGDHEVRQPLAKQIQPFLGVVGGADVEALRCKCGS